MREVWVGDLDGVGQSGDAETMESLRHGLNGLERLMKGPEKLKMWLEKGVTRGLQNGCRNMQVPHWHFLWLNIYFYDKRFSQDLLLLLLLLIKRLSVYKLKSESTESVDLHKTAVITDIRNDVTLQNKKARASKAAQPCNQDKNRLQNEGLTLVMSQNNGMEEGLKKCLYELCCEEIKSLQSLFRTNTSVFGKGFTVIYNGIPQHSNMIDSAESGEVWFVLKLDHLYYIPFWIIECSLLDL